jgi:hypothetical protein
VSMRYHGAIGGADAEITAAVSAFGAHLPVSAAGTSPMRGATQRARLTGDFARDVHGVRVRYGVSYDHLALFHRIESRAGVTPGRIWEGEVRGDAAGSYAEASWQPAPTVRLRGGLRGDLFFADAGVRLAPRLSATWMLGERAALTAAAGRYHQYVRTSRPESIPRPGGAPEVVFLPGPLAVDGATHLNLALHQEFSEGVRLGVEGFFKVFTGGDVGGVEQTNASGVDIWLRRDVGVVRGWLGYSLSWLWTLSQGRTVSDEFAGRHLLNAGVAGPLGGWADVEVRFAYGAGLPWSAISLDAPASPEGGVPGYSNLQGRSLAAAGSVPFVPQPPSSPYLRLDVSLSRTYETRWRDTPVAFSPYLKVMNSLDRRDALFYWADGHGGSPRAVAALPVLPVLGLGWRF